MTIAGIASPERQGVVIVQERQQQKKVVDLSPENITNYKCICLEQTIAQVPCWSGSTNARLVVMVGFEEAERETTDVVAHQPALPSEVWPLIDDNGTEGCTMSLVVLHVLGSAGTCFIHNFIPS